MNPADYVVDPDIARAETLPASAFTDPAFLEREYATVFAKHWSFVPRRPAADLADDPRDLDEHLSVRGVRVPVGVAGRPVFLQRDWEGRLRAFPNVCTHAWHTLVPGIARERFITCPQHGREFDCSGRLTKHPGFGRVEGFPRAEDHLRELSVAQWDRWLFAALGDAAAPLDAVLAPVRESLECLPLDRLTRRPQTAEMREVPGNWKLHAWNYLDRYHIGFLHRAPGGLADAVDLKSYRVRCHEHAVLQVGYATDPAQGFLPEQVPARLRDTSPRRRPAFAIWWYLFPNTTLNFYPWGLSVNVYEPVPGRPDRTNFLWYHWSWDDERYAERERVYLNAQVDAEDVDAIGQVRRGVASGFAVRGRFAPTEEEGPHWLHRKVYEAVFG